MLPVTESCYNCTLNNVSHTPQRLAINSTGLNYSEASASFAINTELEIKVYLGISHHRRFCQVQWRPVQCTVGVPVSTGLYLPRTKEDKPALLCEQKLADIH